MHISFIPRAALLALLFAVCTPIAAQQKTLRVVMPGELGLVGDVVMGTLEEFLTRNGYEVLGSRYSGQLLAEHKFQRNSLMINQMTVKPMSNFTERADIECFVKLVREGGYTNIQISLLDYARPVLAMETGGMVVGETVQGDDPVAIRAAAERMAGKIAEAVVSPVAKHMRPVVAVPEPIADAPMDRWQLKGIIENGLAKSGKYRVYPDWKKLHEKLIEERKKSLQSNKELTLWNSHDAADFVCASKISSEKGYTYINVSLIDLKTGVVARQASELTKGTDSAGTRVAAEKAVSRITGAELMSLRPN
jgi:hypothetical protein